MSDLHDDTIRWIIHKFQVVTFHTSSQPWLNLQTLTAYFCSSSPSLFSFSWLCPLISQLTPHYWLNLTLIWIFFIPLQQLYDCIIQQQFWPFPQIILYTFRTVFPFIEHTNVTNNWSLWLSIRSVWLSPNFYSFRLPWITEDCLFSTNSMIYGSYRYLTDLRCLTCFSDVLLLISYTFNIIFMNSSTTFS